MTHAILDNVATRTELRGFVRRLKIWLGLLAIAAAGLLFAALHRWPPH